MKDNLKKTLIIVIIPIILALSFAAVKLGTASTKKVEYYEIIELFENNEVSECVINLNSGELKYNLRSDKTDTKDKNSNNKTSGDKTTKTYNHRYTIPNVGLFVEDFFNDFIIENNRKYDVNSEQFVKYDYSNAGSKLNTLMSAVPSLLSVFIILGFGIYFIKRMGSSFGGGDKIMGFGKAKIKKPSEDGRKTTFADVAGADEEKEELSEIVEFLKSPAKFNELGARIPKGVLLVGPPGTGKTLLARAVAGEAGVPFFSISGSDFVEMYVGVGASRVRDLFEQAKKNSPSIIFIDEIDAVGRQRGAGLGGGHDEREQTLNQLLVEMDGFGANQGVIVIAATNRPDILDKALLRPGRFDRRITVNYPDVKGREEILKVHARGKPFAPDVSLKTIAQTTAGFSGADLENLLNEAALLAARQGKKAITQPNIEEATIKVVMGTEKKSHVISDKDKKITSYHEAGHAVVSYFLPTQDPVHQISIIPRGMAAGYTMYVPTDEKTHMSKKQMTEDICSLLGGRAAEQLTQDDVCTGASNDMERATELARKMVTKYGMSDKLGLVTYGTGNDEVFLGRDFSATPNYSEKIAALIDDEIESIIMTQYNRALEILKGAMDKVHEIAKELFLNEKIDGERFLEIMEGNSDIEETSEPENNV